MTTGTGSIEVEWQFDAPDLDAVERWLRAQPAHAAFTLVDRGEKAQHDTYYDTDDWRAYFAGTSLRVRAKEGASESTLKGLARSASGPAQRAEFTQPGDVAASTEGDPGADEGPVSARLRLILRGRPLRPLFTVVTRRRTWLVRSAGTDLAEIAIDDTAIGVPGGQTATLRRVEIEETRPGGLAAAHPLVVALRAACGLTPAATSKFEAGLAAAGLRPSPGDFGPTEVSDDDRAADRAYAVLRRLFGEFLSYEAGTALGEDPEQLHQMRVSTRRLRAALRVFEPVIAPALVASRDELRWFAQGLGAVRDLDVQLEHFEALRERSGWDEATALTPLIAQFERRRADARSALLVAFEQPRYAQLVASIREALVAGPPTDAPDEASRDLARQVTMQRTRRFRRDARRIRRDSPLAEFHALRIRGKRLRYSLELFADLTGAEGARSLRALRRFQDLLGELQDLDTTDQHLRDIVTVHAAELPPETLVLVGRLMERSHARAAEIVAAYRGAVGEVLRNEDRLRRALRPPAPERPAPPEEDDAPPPAEPAVETPAEAEPAAQDDDEHERHGFFGMFRRRQDP